MFVGNAGRNIILYCIFQCIDGIKSSVKLQLMSEEEGGESGANELVIDLGRALFKLHFQLLLVLEASQKMVSTLSSVARRHKVIFSYN